MKKVLVILLVLALAVSSLALVACDNGTTDEAVAVTFMDVEGNELAVVEAVNGKVTPPSTAKDGLSFVGWFELIDGNVDLDGTPVDFAKTAVKESMVVYGSWTEITVTFRHLSGKAIAQAKVAGGKVTAPEVTVADGFMFDGWYFGKTTVNADGSSTFALTEKWDETAPTANVDLYANILDLKGTGAYHVAGGYVTGGPGWTFEFDAAKNPEFAMTYDATEGVYTQTIVHNAGGFRILDTTMGAWNSAYNASNVGAITLADGVTMPEGFTATIGDNASDLFKNEGGGDQNILMADTGYQFEIEVTLSVGLKTIDLHITKITKIEPPVWALVGKGADVFDGAEWKQMVADMNDEAKFAVADGKGTLTVEFVNGAEWKVVNGIVGWGSDSNNLKAVTVADGVTLPEGATAETVISVAAGGNITVTLAGYTVAADITFDVTTKEISVEITAVTASEVEPITCLAGAGSTIFDDGEWNAAPKADSASNMVETETTATITATFTNGAEFKVVNNDVWVGYNGETTTVTVADGVTLPADMTAASIIVDNGGNIKVVCEGYTVTLNVTIDIATSVITIEITAITAVAAA